MLPCPKCLKIKVLGEVNWYLFLSWETVLYANTRLLKVHRNWDNKSCRNLFLSGGFFYSELTLVNPNSFMLGHKTGARTLLSQWLLLMSGRKWQVIGSKSCCKWNNDSKRSNLVSMESTAVISFDSSFTAFLLLSFQTRHLYGLYNTSQQLCFFSSETQ